MENVMKQTIVFCCIIVNKYD